MNKQDLEDLEKQLTLIWNSLNNLHTYDESPNDLAMKLQKITLDVFDLKMRIKDGK